MQNWQEEEIISPLLFLATLWSCHGKRGIWNIEKIVTLFSWNDDKKEFVLQAALIYIANQLLTRHSPSAPLCQVDEGISNSHFLV